MNPLKAGLSLAVALVVLAGGWWAWGEYRERQSERRAVAEAEANRQAAVVASLEDSLQAARAASLRVDTLALRVLAPRLPTRPTVPAETILVALPADSLVGIIRAQDVHIDTLTNRLTVTMAVLDTVATVARRFRLFADSTIAAQGRQIVAMQVVIDTPKPRRRFGIGGSCGYGIVVGGTVASGPGCTAGLSFSF